MSTRNKVSPCDLALFADSPPFLLARNKGRYLFDVIAPQASRGFNSLTAIRERSWLQTQYFKEQLTGINTHNAGIPSYLLNDALIEDLVAADNYLAILKKRSYDGKTQYGIYSHRSSSSTITSFAHESRQYLAFAFGSNLSDITIRSAASCYFDPAKHLNGVDCGASVSIEATNGAIQPSMSIQQMFSAGSSCFGSAANILARTEDSIYHFQSRIFEDSMLTEFRQRRESSNTWRNYLYDLKETVTLYPLQKFKLSSIIADMDCHNNSSRTGAAVVDTTGLLYDWTPSSGIQKVYAKPIYDADLLRAQSAFTTSRVCLSSHPAVIFTSLGKSIYICDRRCPIRMKLPELHSASADVFALTTVCRKSASPFASNTIGHISPELNQHVTSDYMNNIILYSQPNRVNSVDIRFAREVQGSRAVDSSHYTMNRMDAVPNQSVDDLIVGFSRTSRNVSIHSTRGIEAVTSSSNPSPHVPSSSQRHSLSGIYRILNSSTLLGSKGSFDWNVFSFPVLERSAWPNVTLAGAHLIPIHDEDLLLSKGTADEDEWIESGVYCVHRRQDCMAELLEQKRIVLEKKENNLASSSMLLLQQSSLGDIAVQVISRGDRSSHQRSMVQMSGFAGLSCPTDLRFIPSQKFSSRRVSRKCKIKSRLDTATNGGHSTRKRPLSISLSSEDDSEICSGSDLDDSSSIASTQTALSADSSREMGEVYRRAVNKFDRSRNNDDGGNHFGRQQKRLATGEINAGQRRDERDERAGFHSQLKQQDQPAARLPNESEEKMIQLVHKINRPAYKKAPELPATSSNFFFGVHCDALVRQEAIAYKEQKLLPFFTAKRALLSRTNCVQYVNEIPDRIAAQVKLLILTKNDFYSWKLNNVDLYDSEELNNSKSSELPLELSFGYWKTVVSLWLLEMVMTLFELSERIIREFDILINLEVLRWILLTQLSEGASNLQESLVLSALPWQHSTKPGTIASASTTSNDDRVRSNANVSWTKSPATFDGFLYRTKPRVHSFRALFNRNFELPFVVSLQQHQMSAKPVVYSGSVRRFDSKMSQQPQRNVLSKNSNPKFTPSKRDWLPGSDGATQDYYHSPASHWNPQCPPIHSPTTGILGESEDVRSLSKARVAFLDTVAKSCVDQNREEVEISEVETPNENLSLRDMLARGHNSAMSNELDSISNSDFRVVDEALRGPVDMAMQQPIKTLPFSSANNNYLAMCECQKFLINEENGIAFPQEAKFPCDKTSCMIIHMLVYSIVGGGQDGIGGEFTSGTICSPQHTHSRRSNMINENQNNYGDSDYAHSILAMYMPTPSVKAAASQTPFFPYSGNAINNRVEHANSIIRSGQFDALSEELIGRLNSNW